jgi:D-hydroxyproline dehydrogenase subunit gamma
MRDRRIEIGIERGQRSEIQVDGEKVVAYQGETIAAALIASGRRTFRRTQKKNEPRGMYCGIGLCFECEMEINGVPNTRACQTLVTPGCQVKTKTSPDQTEDKL